VLDLFHPASAVARRENESLPLNDKQFENRAYNGSTDRLSFIAASAGRG